MCYENITAENLFTLQKNYPFLAFSKFHKIPIGFSTNPKGLNFLGGRWGPLELDAKTCCQNLLQFGKRVIFSNVNNFSANFIYAMLKG